MQNLNLDPHDEAEDVPSVDEADVDEIRHIFLSGGTGIPIGPVSANTLLLSTCILINCQSRTAFLDRSYPQLPLNM